MNSKRKSSYLIRYIIEKNKTIILKQISAHEWRLKIYKQINKFILEINKYWVNSLATDSDGTFMNVLVLNWFCPCQSGICFWCKCFNVSTNIFYIWCFVCESMSVTVQYQKVNVINATKQVLTIYHCDTSILRIMRPGLNLCHRKASLVKLYIDLCVLVISW